LKRIVGSPKRIQLRRTSASVVALLAEIIVSPMRGRGLGLENRFWNSASLTGCWLSNSVRAEDGAGRAANDR